MSKLTRSVTILLTLAHLGVAATALAQPAPAGWRITAANAPGIERTYEFTALPTGQYLRVEQAALQRLAGAGIDTWLTATASADPSPDGSWMTSPRTSNVVPGTMATVSREFVSSGGSRGGRIYLGVAGGDAEARVVRLTFSSGALLKSPQGAAARELMSELAKESLVSRRGRAGTVAHGAADAANERARPVPTSRTGFRPGGAIMPGRYRGEMVNDEGRVIVRYDVTLFANGEYAAPSGDNLLDSTGTYKYVAATGRLDIDGKLYNSTYTPDEDFCLFGREATGTAAIYMEEHYGIGTFRALLRRVSDPDRESPTVVLAARKAAQAEAARYKFVTAPGAGLRESQIETVYYEWKQVYEIGGLQFKEKVFLLLKDGTVRQGLPVPPQDLDVPASRRAEPEEWGRWRRVGARYEFAFGAGAAFAPKQGHIVVPLRAGVNLVGRFEGNSSYQIPGGAGAWSNFGVLFSDGARFEIFRSGGAGMTAGYGDTRISTAAVYDDDGSVGGASGSNIAAGSSRRTPDTGNRRGTYRVDGYAIVLTYQNGKVERLPFVIEQKAGGQVEGVWMMESLLTPPKK